MSSKTKTTEPKWPKGALPRGTRVRFTVKNLGASERDDLGHVTEDFYGPADTGVVGFPHANQRADGCRDWVFVEVDSKSGPARKLYVGVHPSMIEAVSS